MSILIELVRCFLPSSDAFLFMWLLAALGITAFSVVGWKWLTLRSRTDYDAQALFSRVRNLLDDKRFDDAYQICSSGGHRALPRVLASGIIKAKVDPRLATSAMTEESMHHASALEKRLGLLVMFGNVSTLFGLLGTVFGLIMSFDAVSRPDVAAGEKSALLAAGISTAMNSTLVGLTISVLCVMAYAWLRARVDSALHEMDRYAVAILNVIYPPDYSHAEMKSLVRRGEGEEEAADADVTPMLNLMVMLIPVLLTSSEYVRMGDIELKLPESQGAGAGGGGANEQQELKLQLGVVITAKGFNLSHYFKLQELAAAKKGAAIAPPDSGTADIPLVNGAYDYATLAEKLAEVKRKALLEIVRASDPGVPAGASLLQLYTAFVSKNLPLEGRFPDNESIMIVAEEKVKYQTVVAVMDAARGMRSADGNVTMFPNVSLGGGIVQ
jgi:biopolymer transport protein ExbB/TolQ/biopolymer transport protein ExbD